MIVKTPLRISRRVSRPLGEWSDELTRTEKCWSGRPECPMLPREVAALGFLRDRLNIAIGLAPIEGELSDRAVEATLTLMLRRGSK